MVNEIAGRLCEWHHTTKPLNDLVDAHIHRPAYDSLTAFLIVTRTPGIQVEETQVADASQTLAVRRRDQRHKAICHFQAQGNFRPDNRLGTFPLCDNQRSSRRRQVHIVKSIENGS